MGWSSKYTTDSTKKQKAATLDLPVWLGKWTPRRAVVATSYKWPNISGGTGVINTLLTSRGPPFLISVKLPGFLLEDVSKLMALVGCFWLPGFVKPNTVGTANPPNPANPANLTGLEVLGGFRGRVGDRQIPLGGDTSLMATTVLGWC